MKLELVEHDQSWSSQFLIERERLRKAIGGHIEILHLGSTSVPGLKAKPKIDMFFSCPTPQPSLEEHQVILDLGYIPSANMEKLGHHAYNREDVRPAFTIHWFLDGSPGLRKAIWFRDRLMNDGNLRHRYDLIKTRALEFHPEDSWAYNQHKAPLILEILEQFFGE
jgi:GrpB-like predicted nucleotidyltransferase (UPF0157 family)